MTADSWRPLLHGLSRNIVSDPDLMPRVTAAELEAGFVGREGAAPHEVAEAERRLGTSLPRSYREFLLASNGWGVLSHAIWRLWSTAELEWFKTRNQRWIDIWTKPRRDGRPRPDVPDEDYFVYGPSQESYNIRERYLPSMLEISDKGDAAVLLLNPEVVSQDGEWEAWFFASWLNGAMRFPSFADLMQYHVRRAAERAAT